MMLRQFVAPPLYVQGPGALQQLAEIAARLGRRSLVVTDPGVERALGSRLRDVIGQSATFSILRSEITPSSIAELVTAAATSQCDVVIGFGGGKALDAGKAVARDTRARFISVPTIASNDAPTSQAIALYSDIDHAFMVQTLNRNPDAVVVDTEVLAGAPPQYLRFGIGDALAKAAEAEGCAASSIGRTPLGYLPSAAGLALARACRQSLHAEAARALAVAGSGKPNVAFESVVEAVVLMSGLGFENGGLSVAHAMTRGLTVAPRTKLRAHGEHVAYGLMVHLALDAEDGDLTSERRFVRSVGLPVSLQDFDDRPVDEAEIQFLAQSALTAPQHIRNYPRPLGIQDIARAIQRVENLHVSCPD
jgi:glycerol dehydrogenase